MSSEPIALVHEEDSVEGVHVLDLDVDEETGTNLQGRASGSVKRKRHLKSQLWQYFEMLPEVEGKEKRCKCKACGTTYKAYSSMGTETIEVRLDDLTENIMNLFINEDAGSNNTATDD
ncbi:uncharacterized protein LOC142556504 [Primulina tabacum]|uniref:uncharacterized protein LOC142534643 n=1 Tax=Primulina tabacum TaxID=48773 RepID=UPI003F59A107